MKGPPPHRELEMGSLHKEDGCTKLEGTAKRTRQQTRNEDEATSEEQDETTSEDETMSEEQDETISEEQDETMSEEQDETMSEGRGREERRGEEITTFESDLVILRVPAVGPTITD